MKISLIVLTSIFLWACTKENLSDCGRLNIQFRYDKNTEGIDKFPSEIDKINLYVFDANGIFIGEYTDEGSHLDANYKMFLPLKPGIYHIIVWGNLRDDFEVKPLQVGVSTFEDAKLRIKRETDDNISKTIEPLFHGALYQLNVNPLGNQTHIVSMIKNTNTIRVKFLNFPPEENPSTEKPSYTCRITDTNGTYKFDNSLANNHLLQYIPRIYSQDTLTYEFTTVRLFQESPARIIVEKRIGGIVVEEVINQSLIGILLKHPYIQTQDDLDIQDMYNLEVKFGTSIIISVNDWVIVDIETPI